MHTPNSYCICLKKPIKSNLNNKMKKTYVLNAKIVDNLISVVTSVVHDEMPNGILLEVSFMPKAISISELSDEDFTEQECEDSRQKVNTGLLPKLTIWIASRLANLEIQIERANLRGRNKQYPS
ncbi:unnamed protein product [Vicia faba]|uniref:Uncharacterized protein n=1 Tax=Vicia faba TaxID=3906 RepID=A0AAV1AZ79_VICFA|nr:unnamed protein product [Vicia faba]